MFCFQDSSKEFTVWTFNQSEVLILDLDGNEVSSSMDSQYNYNEKEQKWEPGESDWETVELVCTAYGGRPHPTFRWYIDDNQDKDLHNFEKFR